jgi:Tol biopolymer transport system component
VTFTIVTAPATSTDLAYNGVNPPDVSVLNQDDDSAQIFVAPTGGLFTTEMGGMASFNIRLGSEPTSPVTIGLTSSDTSEGTVPPMMTLNVMNWSMGVTVNVTGVNDAMDDGDVNYTVVTMPAFSGDPAYNGLNPADVSVTNRDDDTAAIIVTPPPPAMAFTRESGGSTSFTVRLGSQPTAEVSINLSLPADEASSPTQQIAIPPASWNMPFVVNITGVDDGILDNDAPYTVALGISISADPIYTGINPMDVSLTNIDDGELTPTIFANNQNGPVYGHDPSTSFDGSLTVYESALTVVPPDQNNARDIFLYNRRTGQNLRVSVDVAGGDASSDSTRPVISGDGRWVAFESNAIDLAPNDMNAVQDIFLRDLMTSQTTLVSLNTNGTSRTEASSGPAITPDGRFVAYAIASAAGCIQVYDHTTGGTMSGGNDSSCRNPAISGDGRYVVYEIGPASDPDVRLYDRITASFSIQVNAANTVAWGPSITPDGRYIVYSGVQNVDGDGFSDVFLYDRITTLTEMISVASNGMGGNGPSDRAHISDDAGFITFVSAATNFGTGALGPNTIYQVDRLAMQVAQVVAGDAVGRPKLSGNGRFITYAALEGTGLPTAQPVLWLTSTP